LRCCNFAVVAPIFGSGDVAVTAAVGWPRWPIHVVAGLGFLLNLRPVYKLRQEAHSVPERYLPRS
jgi:hypothetical protein